MLFSQWQGFITRKWEHFEKHILAPHTVRLQILMPHEESVQNLRHPWENDGVQHPCADVSEFNDAVKQACVEDVSDLTYDAVQAGADNVREH
jgi:hypothetical protein